MNTERKLFLRLLVLDVACYCSRRRVHRASIKLEIAKHRSMVAHIQLYNCNQKIKWLKKQLLTLA